MFWICFSICFVCLAWRSTFNYLNYRKHRLVERKYVVILTYVAMGVFWFFWFNMNLNDPVKAALPMWFRSLGLFMFVAGVSLFVIAHRGMRGFEEKGQLVTTGVDAKVRNPMYLGFVLWVIGLPVFLQSMLTLASAVFWIAHFLYWKNLEEKELAQKFSEYREYKKRTWF